MHSHSTRTTPQVHHPPSKQPQPPLTQRKAAAQSGSQVDPVPTPSTTTRLPTPLLRPKAVRLHSPRARHASKLYKLRICSHAFFTLEAGVAPPSEHHPAAQITEAERIRTRSEKVGCSSTALLVGREAVRVAARPQGQGSEEVVLCLRVEGGGPVGRGYRYFCCGSGLGLRTGRDGGPGAVVCCCPGWLFRC